VFLPCKHLNTWVSFSLFLSTTSRLNIISVRTQEQFTPLIADVRANKVFVIPFLEITEAMELLHEKPYRTDRPPENKIRSIDYTWHMPRDESSRPPHAEVGALYNGFVVHMEQDENKYLVYNNTRHLFPDDATMELMGFNNDMVLRFRYSRLHPVSYRIMDNIPLGDPVPKTGVTVRITPTYELRPIK
jgi:hypothetical protein